MNKNLKKGLKEAKEGKIIKIGKVENLFEKMIRKQKKYSYYRVYLYFYRLFCRIWRFPGNVKAYIRDFIQRGHRGWANSDTWGLSFYLSKVIAESLKYLKKNKMGYPCGIKEDYKKAKKKWDNILDTMIKTFEIARKIDEGEIYYIPSKEFTHKLYKRLVRTVKKINKKYRTVNKVLNLKEIKLFELGFDYFKKYYFNLWD